MEYSINSSIDTNLSNENMEGSEIEKEVIVCNDENLMKYIVDVTEILLESIWKSSQIIQPSLCPLHDYLCHVIRQSKITLYTLKCAIIYFVRISRQLQDKRWRSKIRLFCGRRMFLGSVIIASKYLYDRTYSNSMWAKILGLDIKEVNNVQMDFLEALNYDLFISRELDSIWSQMLENFIVYLKAKNEEQERQDFDDSFENTNGLASPLNSPAIPIKMMKSSFVSGVRQPFPNSPISPVSSMKTFNGYEHEENVKSLRTKILERERNIAMGSFQNTVMKHEFKRLEEYRPFVKVLIQVIFMYSSKNTLPVGEKRVIELPKLATTPDRLFYNSLENTGFGMDYARNNYTLLQLRKRLSANKMNTRKIQMYKYYFSQAFPNHHLINKMYHSCSTGYYSDSIGKHLSSFHLYKKRFCYRRVKEANDEICGMKEKSKDWNVSINTKEVSSEKNQPSPSFSSSSEWDSALDDSSTLIGSSDEEIINLNEQHAPFFNEENTVEMNNYPQKVFEDSYELSQETEMDQSSYWDSLNYKKFKSLNHHEQSNKRDIPITPNMDSEENDFTLSKTILPSFQQQTPSQLIYYPNYKPLYHPKIV